MNNSEILKEIKIAQSMERIYPPVLLSVGIPGNVLSLVVLVRFRQRQCSLYLMFLAGVDLFVLCVSLLLKWIGNLAKTDFRNDSDVACKSHVFAVYSSLQISSWTLVLITCERVCSVMYPHLIRTWCTKARILISLTIMTVCILVLNCHFLVGYHLEYRPYANETTCICKEDFEFFEFKVWPWIDFLFVFSIPCLFFIFGNIVILYKLRISQKFSVGFIRQRGSMKKRAKTFSFLTRMTVSLNIVFIVCVSPVSIVSIGQPFWWPPETTTEHGRANLTLIWTSVTMIMYVNNCVNFLLYIMLGSKFRQELKAIFTLKFFKKPLFSHFGGISIHGSTARGTSIQTIALGSTSDTKVNVENGQLNVAEK